MSKLDAGTGLFSTGAWFVRQPTRRWSGLDTPQPDRASVCGKEALKSRVQRKQHNVLVRKRGFAALRKSRPRAQVCGGIPVMRSLFFHARLPSTTEGWAFTPKKIDAIDAQMRSQWRQGRRPEVPVGGPSARKRAGQISHRAAHAALVPAGVTSFADTLTLLGAQSLASGEAMPGKAGHLAQHRAFSAEDMASSRGGVHPVRQQRRRRCRNGVDGHRLLAVFFHFIGITAHAQVMSRSDPA